ncbi:MAG TPA: Ig-like domain-containing protein [Isosphaeraceae bacterium]|nr:Ig-like domain-containing protein [Isosphaeraceae bacterium]
MRFTLVVLEAADRSTDRHGLRGSRRHRQARSKPVLEVLENRALLAAITAFTVPALNEGQPFSGSVATFTADSGQTAADFQATIDWGDGQPPSTGSVSLSGTDGTVSGVHTYAEEGAYPVIITVTGPGAVQLTAAGQAAVKDATLTISPITFNFVAGTPFSGTVATFSDADPQGLVSDYHAAITWGDGNFGAGQVVKDPNGGFDVIGTNTYGPQQKSYPVTVQVFDSGGSSASTSASQALVGYVSLPLTGQLDPASISGPDKNLNITNVNRPTFHGTAAAYAIVQLTAQQANSDPTTYLSLGQTISGPDGSWSLTAPRLPDGVYTVTASMTSQAGFPTAPVLIVTPDNPLYIDTVGPRVSGMVFDPSTGIITVVISDAWSGLYQNSLLDPTNYVIMPRRNLIGSNSRLPSLNPAISGFYTNAQSATLQFKAPITAGSYLFEVKSGGVIDQAGNPLDGEFKGSLPSGNGVPGGNFIAQLTVPHRRLATPHPRAPRRIRGR